MPVDPEIAVYLEAQKCLPPRSSLTLEQIRKRMVDAAQICGGEPVHCHTLELGWSREYEGGTSPLVIFFHGGRFISGDTESHDPLCRRLATAAQCRLVAVDYTLAPEHPFPSAIEDARNAVEWALWKSDRVVVMGDSAGANLAAVMASEYRKRLSGQVLIYPYIDATSSFPSHQEFSEGYGPSSGDMRRGWELYLPPGADRRDPRISPVFAEDLEGLPPAYVLTAEYDTLRDEGEEYAHRLGMAGNQVELKRWPGAIHGFFALPGMSRISREAIEDAASFLRRCR
jgi:acetyl esterase